MLDKILKKVSHICKIKPLESDYYSDELNSGFKLREVGDKLILLIIDKGEGIDVEYEWPGDKYDYDTFLDELSGGLIWMVPKMVMLLIKQEKELAKLRRNKK